MGISLVCSRRLSRICLCVVSAIVFVLVGFVAGYMVCAGSYQREALEMQRVEEFISQIIDSAMNNTKFLNNHLAQGRYKFLKKHTKDFTDFYKIHIYDRTFHAYECIVTFDNGNKYYVDVVVFKDDIRLNAWTPLANSCGKEE